MPLTSDPPARSPLRDLHFMGQPSLWAAWPFLPLVRRRPPGPPELGLLFDAKGACGLAGHRCTVWKANLFALPPSLDEFLAQPREALDTLDEVVAAGWRVD